MRNPAFLSALVLCALLAACGSPEERAARYLQNAQALYEAGDYTKARLEAQNAAQVEPKNVEARWLLAQIAEQQQEYQQMFGHLMVVAAEDPANVEARLKLGTLYFLGQAWDQAREQVAALMELAPDDARVRLLHARTLIQAGDQAAGIAEIEAAMKLDPDNVEGILLQSSAYAIESVEKGLANIDAAIARLPADESRPLRELRIIMLSQAKRTGDVEADLQSLSRDFPEVEQYQFELARFYTAQGRVEEADQLLKQVVELDPEDVDTRLGYVQFLATQKDVDQAEAALKTFIGESPDTTRLRLALGQLYERSERLPEARETYEALAKLSPKSEDGLAARNRLAALDVQAGNMAAATDRVEAILTDVPDDAQALLLRAVTRVVDGRFDEAVADLRGVLRKDDRNERALLLLAQAYARKGDRVLAKDTYRRLLAVNPASPEGLNELAVLLVADKDLPGAEELLRKRLETQPDDIVASGRLVEVLMAQGQADKAEAEARRMTALQNQTGVGDFQLARVLLQKQDLAGAAESFRKSLASRSNDPLPLEGLVRTLVAQGKTTEAKDVLKGQLDNSQNQLFAKFLLGGIYGREGDRASAERYLEEVLKEKPDSVVAYVSLAGLYRDDPAARMAVYRRGLDAVPGNPELSMLLGTELEVAGRYEDAIALYEGLVKAQPKFLAGINNLAALLLDHREDAASHARALELARALEGAENPAMLDTLGWAYYRTGDHARAVGLLERVVAKAGNFAVFRYHLGMAYAAAGNTVGARQELQAALADAKATFPGRSEAEATLARL